MPEMSNPPFGQKSNTARHQSPVFCHCLKFCPHILDECFDEYIWILSCCETYYYHSMIIFSNHWFLELVAMTASENHRNLRAITDYYGITNPRGFNADHTSDNRHYCYRVWKLKLSGYTLHSFYINQRCFFCSTWRKTTWIWVLKIFRRFSLQNPSKWVREGWMHIPFFCPSLVQ